MKRFLAVLMLLAGLLVFDASTPQVAEAQCYYCVSAAPYAGWKCSDFPDGWTGYSYCVTGWSGQTSVCNGFFICYYGINGECVTTQDDLTPAQRETVEKMVQDGASYEEVNKYVTGTTVPLDFYMAQEVKRRTVSLLPVTSIKVFGMGR